jgi:hypothetical protein
VLLMAGAIVAALLSGFYSLASTSRQAAGEWDQYLREQRQAVYAEYVASYNEAIREVENYRKFLEDIPVKDGMATYPDAEEVSLQSSLTEYARALSQVQVSGTDAAAQGALTLHDAVSAYRTPPGVRWTCSEVVVRVPLEVVPLPTQGPKASSVPAAPNCTPLAISAYPREELLEIANLSLRRADLAYKSFLGVVRRELAEP